MLMVRGFRRAQQNAEHSWLRSVMRIILEHLGMLSEPAYRRRWLAKVDWYRAQGVLLEEDGKGDEGILVTTTEENGIDSASIERRLRVLLGL
ncbi:hypothetical protein [Pseudogemmobacter bohemicus]|uniref:hypothetical protein n=1 Tax=Pseudogemmobacter bohemicus TaxID=2250708 RepID=UPI000DD2F862|nr:hypothetical protein [Pseudogemmobacter bohemicus]